MDWSKLGEYLTSKGAKSRIRKETGQKEPYEREEDWKDKMDPTDRRKHDAIDKANKARKSRGYEDGGVQARKNVLMKIAGRKKKK